MKTKSGALRLEASEFAFEAVRTVGVRYLWSRMSHLCVPCVRQWLCLATGLPKASCRFGAKRVSAESLSSLVRPSQCLDMNEREGNTRERAVKASVAQME